MTIWRPRQAIRVIAIGLHWRDRRLLAAEVTDDTGRVKGVRPLGGGVEFGESWRDTLMREFAEELEITVKITGDPLVMENIYSHEGQQGHEVVFAAPVVFPDRAFEAQDVIHFQEDGGTDCTARWWDPEQLERDGIALYPVGLAARLRSFPKP